MSVLATQGVGLNFQMGLSLSIGSSFMSNCCFPSMAQCLPQGPVINPAMNAVPNCAPAAIPSAPMINPAMNAVPQCAPAAIPTTPVINPQMCAQPQMCCPPPQMNCQPPQMCCPPPPIQSGCGQPQSCGSPCGGGAPLNSGGGCNGLGGGPQAQKLVAALLMAVLSQAGGGGAF